jgi:hypothetical protein
MQSWTLGQKFQQFSVKNDFIYLYYQLHFLRRDLESCLVGWLLKCLSIVATGVLQI